MRKKIRNKYIFSYYSSIVRNRNERVMVCVCMCVCLMTCMSYYTIIQNAPSLKIKSKSITKWD
jgi:hypothetical protein